MRDLIKAVGAGEPLHVMPGPADRIDLPEAGMILHDDQMLTALDYTRAEALDRLRYDIGAPSAESAGAVFGWVVAGGESGAGARPVDRDWIARIWCMWAVLRRHQLGLAPAAPGQTARRGGEPVWTAQHPVARVAAMHAGKRRKRAGTG